MNTITCPNCHTPINIDEVLAHQIEENLTTQFQQEKQALQNSQKQLLIQMSDLKKKSQEEKEKSLAEQEHRLKQELWQKAQDEARKRIQETSGKTIQELEQRVKEQEERTKTAETAELEMRKKQRQLEEREKQLQLQVERELDQRLKVEQEKILKVEGERFSLKEREYQKQIEDMKAAVDEARRKASTVSQQLQGEVMELELEKILKESFPGDSIDEVKKGQFGADILHTVRDGFGKTVGIIVWESKQTERFSDKWLAKLREDCRACHGSVAVLVTRSLPDDIQTCGERDRVWITNLDFVLPLAQLLRQTLVKVQQEKTAQSGKDIKTEMLYQYINSHEFHGRVEGIVESFCEMKDDLDREQRALQNLWKKREKQILRLATNTAYMYGEIQGLVGSSLPSIQGLEIETSTVAKKITSKNDNLVPVDQNELF